MVVYLIGMIVIIGVAKDSPLRVITDVRYALGAYCAIDVTCIVSMLVFFRSVEDDARGRE
jgi:hypothetical protein